MIVLPYTVYFCIPTIHLLQLTDRVVLRTYHFEAVTNHIEVGSEEAKDDVTVLWAGDGELDV